MSFWKKVGAEASGWSLFAASMAVLAVAGAVLAPWIVYRSRKKREMERRSGIDD